MSGQGSVPLLHRLLVGEAPWLFLLEVSCRALLVYVALFIVMRLLGKRMAAQLSISEMAVMLTLGAAIGAPLQTPSQGVLPAVVLLACALVFQRGLSALSFRWRRVEVAVQGDVTLLLKDGRLLMDQVRAAGLTLDRVHSELRGQGIVQLGQLRRVYLESTGRFTLLTYRQPRPGLSLIPDAPASEQPSADGALSCICCGYTATAEAEGWPRCPYCEHDHWQPATPVARPDAEASLDQARRA
jgi:uncharacterized membrane protein YcaP (DUF421 family)